jgi:hypothetical protein
MQIRESVSFQTATKSVEESVGCTETSTYGPTETWLSNKSVRTAYQLLVKVFSTEF